MVVVKSGQSRRIQWLIRLLGRRIAAHAEPVPLSDCGRNHRGHRLRGDFLASELRQPEAARDDDQYSARQVPQEIDAGHTRLVEWIDIRSPLAGNA